MTKTMIALAAAATLAVAAAATPAQAYVVHHHHHGGAFFGGLAAGAIIGGAFAPRYYGEPYGYYYGECWRERVWTPYGWRWTRVCR